MWHYSRYKARGTYCTAACLYDVSSSAKCKKAKGWASSIIPLPGQKPIETYGLIILYMIPLLQPRENNCQMYFTTHKLQLLIL